MYIVYIIVVGSRFYIVNHGDRRIRYIIMPILVKKKNYTYLYNIILSKCISVCSTHYSTYYSKRWVVHGPR